jgi:hypothetical protein
MFGSVLEVLAHNQWALLLWACDEAARVHGGVRPLFHGQEGKKKKTSEEGGHGSTAPFKDTLPVTKDLGHTS